MTQVNTNLRPYEVLVETVRLVHEQNRGRYVTVNFDDIGIVTKKRILRLDDGSIVLKNRFFRTSAIEINGIFWFVGALARNYYNQDNKSYIYGFEYNWEKVFQRARPGTTPRLMPPHVDDIDFNLPALFSYKNAFIDNNKGEIMPAMNLNRKFVLEKDLSDVVTREVRLDHAVKKYTPNSPELLAQILIDSLAKKQQYCRQNVAKGFPHQ